MRSKELLYNRYIKPIKTAPKAYIGVEFEFPIVNTLGNATDITVSKELLAYLVEQHGFQSVKKDEDGAHVQIMEPISGDSILFEVSYNILEFAFKKSLTIQEVDKRFKNYLTIIQPYLHHHSHELQGWGVHPHWAINDNRPVALPRYQMLLSYLALSDKEQTGVFHSYPNYGAFICGNQVQLDISKQTLIPTLNRFNQLEPIKAYLFANSTFWGSGWNTRLSRDIFWEESMHGKHMENTGLYTRRFTGIDDFINYLDRTSLFTTMRDGKMVYFSPIRAKDYFSKSIIEAYDLQGDKINITPREEDFYYHRSYNYEDLTTRGTVEFRSTCTQSLDKNFVPVAFHVGLFNNLEKLGDYLDNFSLYQKYNHDYRKMRRLFAGTTISKEDKKELEVASAHLIQMAEEGLKNRGFSEEVYLKNLK
ncbi:glutamate-cysteine ligase family protein [Streptococcus sciuri]|uniref:glutamate--cysteine ligase n=1 Tax=Streptococcus sciuri TaxID=2973939 RepID=A0ABT2F8S3_9STRE|nr:glutamate-cysteine ligase family protein [Streptococcus sciuri]MCS4488824.1 glutamate-cysteine ligase family protein [Streptococcus sciuri]